MNLRFFAELRIVFRWSLTFGIKQLHPYFSPETQIEVYTVLLDVIADKGGYAIA